jgi:glycosyltransferase involved in cell wall biosynthesis
MTHFRELRNRLSATLIVRNEARHLPGCLESLQHIADEVVIVDTGSEDETPEIAKAHGASLSFFKWNGSFSDARNTALLRARGDWVLYIDADERVRPFPRDQLNVLLSDKDKLAYTVRFYPQEGFSPYPEVRLFRKHPRIAFHSVVHETIWPSIRGILADEPYKLGDSDLVLDHLGLEEDQTGKYELYLPLVISAMRENPDRIYLYTHLARIYIGLGEVARALGVWEDALRVLRAGKEPLPADALVLTDCITFRQEQGLPYYNLLLYARKLFPANYHLMYLEARHLISRKAYIQAIDLLECIIKSTEAEQESTCVSYDKNLFCLFAVDSLGTCFFRLGKYDLAEGCFAKCGKTAPDYESRLGYEARRKVCAKQAFRGHKDVH